MMTLTYTINDDGVHLTCAACGQDENLGFDATPEKAVEVAAHHAGLCVGEKPRRCERCGVTVYRCTTCEPGEIRWHHNPMVYSEAEYDCSAAGGPIVTEAATA